LLYDPKDYPKMITMRKMIDILSPEERSEIFLDRLLKTASNDEFLKNLAKG
jgi:transcription termination factor Rho